MKTAPQDSDGDSGRKTASGKPDDPHAQQHSRKMQDASAPLPHEQDQHPESQHEGAPRHVGKQAHRDVEQGLEDTDRRGGDDYQERTQNDSHANRNSSTGKRH